MGTEYAVACVECRLFINLHKWPVIEELKQPLADAYLNAGERIILPDISSYPVVYFNAQEGIEVLSRIRNESSFSQGFIRIVSQTLSTFLPEHHSHTLILVSDMGINPWHIGEPVWDEWKEIIAAFDFDARFLPRNLVDDFSFTSWDLVIAFYEEQEGWFLHNQMQEQLKELEKRFCEYADKCKE